MPYKDKVKDREWHRDVMRKRRAKLKLEDEVRAMRGSRVTPKVLSIAKALRR